MAALETLNGEIQASMSEFFISLLKTEMDLFRFCYIKQFKLMASEFAK